MRRLKTALTALATLTLLTGCTDFRDTLVIHDELLVEKEGILVLSYDDYTETLNSHGINYSGQLLDHNDTYLLFVLSTDKDGAVDPALVFECGARGDTAYFDEISNAEITTKQKYAAYAEFPKKELDKHNCLQAGGQTRDLTGSLYRYTEYVANRITPVEHTVTSNTITYTAQEINEAFAVFGE